MVKKKLKVGVGRMKAQILNIDKALASFMESYIYEVYNLAFPTLKDSK